MEEFNDSLNGNDGIPLEPIRFEGPSSGSGHFEGEGAQEADQRDFVMMSDSYGDHVQGSQAQGIGVNREDGMMHPERLPGNYNYMNRLQNNADISRDTASDFGNMDSYRRSGPEGSPAFQHSGGFLPSIGSDNESSVIFRPVRQLDFSALDETGQTDEIIPHGMNRSVSTPEHEVQGMSYLEREVCGSQADDENTRETSPETGFFELKSSPLQTSESEGELDSRVIFSPLNNGGMGNMYNMSMSFEPNLNQGDGVNNNGPQTSDMAARSQYSPPSRPFDNQGSPQQQYQMSPVTSHSAGKRSVFVNVPNDSGYNQSQSPRLPCVDDLHIQSVPQSQYPQTHIFSSSLPPRLQGAPRSPPRNQGQITHGIGSPQSVKLNAQSYHRSVENSPHEQHPTRAQTSNSLQGHDQMSDLPHSHTADPSQRLPSPSAWKIPGDQPKQNRNLFKEPKMAAPKRTGNGQTQNNNRPTMPAKNSQREVVNPMLKTRQEQAKQQDIGVRVKGQSSDMRPGNNAGTKSNRVVGPPAIPAQQQRGGPNSRPVGENVARKGAPMDRKNNMAQRSTVVAGKKLDRTQQSHPSEYERKVEGSLHRNRSERSRTIGQVSSSSDRGAGIGEDSSSPHTQHPGRNVVTQVQQYGRDPRPEEFGQRVIGKQQQIPHNGVNVHGGDTSLDIQGMENVRSQLQSMLKLSSDTLNETHQYNHVDSVSGLLMDTPQDPYLYQAPLDQSVARGNEDASELYEKFPSFTSRIWSDTSNVSRSDSSLHQENQRLKDMLEKERYRRKHCEQHIQKLNVKLLETQQQVAVAVSTDKRKDIMIEQLDKQLAKVVEGWKKRDEDKEEYIKQVDREKAQMEENLSKQQSITANFEQDMSRAVNEIRQEKEDAILTIQKLRTEADDYERSRIHLEDIVKSERERTELMEQEWQKVRENRELNEMKVQQLQDRLHKEQDEWFKREQELLHRVEEVTEKNIKIVQQERAKNVELEREVKELEEKRQKSQTDIKRLEMDMDVTTREKESLKVEMGIMEDKYETSQRTLEAELHSQMQKEIASQIADVHKRMEEEEETMRENHRRQMTELGQRHSREMEKQLARYHDDLKNREDESRKLYQEYEQKLHDSRTEITSLQSTKQKLESQRSEILTKLQYMMQSQWNEAVSLLSGSPHRKKPSPSNVSFLSTAGQSDEGGQSYSQSGGPLVNSLATDTADHTPVGVSESGPFNPELSLADFSTSLHLQQLLQSLSHPGIRGPSASEAVCSSTYDQGTNRLETARKVDTNADRSTNPGTRQQQTTTLNQETLRMPSNPQTTMNEEVFRNPNNSQTVVNPEDFRIPNSTQVSFQNTDRLHAHDTSLRSDLYNQSVHNWLHEASITSLQPAAANNFDWSTQQAKIALVADQQQQLQPQPIAVPIRPPQQHSSEVQQYEQTPDSTLSEHPPDWSQPGHSPPTKLQGHHRIREDHDHSDGDEENSRLDVDYSQLSDRLQEHESRQGHLQHYIQMLLQKPPGATNEDGDYDYENNSQFSHDQTEELDLNDTAQAAQLQRELTRIQQLRDGKATRAGSRQTVATQGNSFQGVLNPDQLADISRLLGQQNELLEQPQAPPQDMEQIAELMEVLKGLNFRQPPKQSSPKGGKKSAPPDNNSPRSPPQVTHRDVAKVKRSLKVAMAGISEGVQGQTASKPLPGSQVKKPDRKVAPVVAGRVRPGQGKVKSSWK